MAIAGAGAEIMAKVGAGAGNKKFGSATGKYRYRTLKMFSHSYILTEHTGTYLSTSDFAIYFLHIIVATGNCNFLWLIINANELSAAAVE